MSEEKEKKSAIWEKQLDLEILRKNLIVYNKVTNLNCFAIDRKGDFIDFEGEKLKFCESFEKGVNDKDVCKDAHLYAAKLSEKIGEPYIFFCPGGMVHWSSPLTINGEFYGAIIAGPVQMGKTDDYTLKEVAEKHDLDDLLLEILKRDVKDIPIIEPERIRYLADMLFILTKEILKDEIEILVKRKKNYLNQAKISEEIHEFKQKNPEEKFDFIQSEKDLMKKVKMGDKTGGKTILNNILGYIYFKSGNDFEIIKMRVLELISMLSRAAVEGGAKQDIIFGMNNEYLKRIFDIDSSENLSRWLIELLDRFTDSVFQVKSSENYYVISKAMSYINEKFMDNLSLTQVADYVFLSPSYLSRLFKKEVGMNFSEYLNLVRIEESKKYLSDTKYSLSQIAIIVGFADQSYYTKVFKKAEGISPGQYRKLNE